MENLKRIIIHLASEAFGLSTSTSFVLSRAPDRPKHLRVAKGSLFYMVQMEKEF
ncbi:MAG: hypothetical protein ACP5O2_00205 [Bacteroidales bacterium]